MNDLNLERARTLLQQFDFDNLFIEELGWDRYREELPIEVGNNTFNLRAVAEKRGLVVFLVRTTETDFPTYAVRRKIERKAAKIRHEHLIIYVDQTQTRQVWQWVKRQPGRPDACREHTFHKGQPGDALLQKLSRLVVTLDEEESISIVDMAGRTRAAFNVERITKKFYERFKKEHAAFLKFVTGITDQGDQQWYASLMLNRLMFVYFIQKKGFLDNDLNYLRNRLQMMQQEQGKGSFHSFYRHFLLRLFHEGLGKKTVERNPALDRLLGKVPYLNGGLFDVHELEEEYSDIQISDDAFERLFDFFEQYHWHLDERPLRKDNEINPDVLGYIFEKYINQKQMGAYYTKEDITEYISKNTIIPYLFDAAQKKCRIAFEGDQSVWNLLQKDPDRYIYKAVRKGCEFPLPPEIEDGVDTTKPDLLERRKGWNKPASEEFALPTEIWREVVVRRQRYEEVWLKLVDGEIQSINDCITYNLNIRQLAQDVIENCEGPMLLRAFWHAIVGRIPKNSNENAESGITILDPTCGSGAFLFAALNILEPLYEACLDRMQSFVAELDQAQEKPHPEKYSDFRAELERVHCHPNQSYFIMKSIILNNLYGVDIMAEAVEICKLRLFLKMVAQVERGDQIEPLPDIDFNIRCGNTLVGFTSYDEVKEAVTTSKGKALLPGMDAGRMTKIEQKAQDLQQAFDIFRRRQVEGDGSVPHEDKLRVRQRLNALEEELNYALAGKNGINVEKERAAYVKWQASHQPFHWFIEYYGIMAHGGFDVIIGNPPYVEYKKVIGTYKVKNFITEPSQNLYAFIMERALELLHSNGCKGFIVPIALVSIKNNQQLRKILISYFNSSFFSHFAIRPAKLFNGVEQRLTIFIGNNTFSSLPQKFSTKYMQWFIAERPTLFEKIENTPIHDIALPTMIPKPNGPVGANVLRKVQAVDTKTISHFIDPYSEYKIYFHRTPGYWIRAMNFLPFFKSPLGDKSIFHIRELSLGSLEHSAFVGAILSSSLYFYHFFSSGNCRNLTLDDVKKFPVGDPDKKILLQFKELYQCLMKNYQENSSLKKRANSEYQEFDWPKAKSIINEIDRVLAGHYRFTEVELDFIINYDIKYRMEIS